MKRFLTFLILSAVICSLAFQVSAAGTERVIDDAQLLSTDEEAALESLISEQSALLNLDIVILTVDSLDGRSPGNYADSYYDSNGYGFGSDGSGLLFLLAMEEREWYISTCGRAISLFPSSAIDDMGSAILPWLSSGEYYIAFSLWLEDLAAYQHTNPSDSNEGSRTSSVNLPISALIGAVVAGIAVLIMRGTMNTARKQSGAGEYVRNGSYHLTLHQDIFLYSHVSKTPKPKNTSSSSGGRSHGGGGGKF